MKIVGKLGRGAGVWANAGFGEQGLGRQLHFQLGSDELLTALFDLGPRA